MAGLVQYPTRLKVVNRMRVFDFLRQRKHRLFLLRLSLTVKGRAVRDEFLRSVGAYRSLNFRPDSYPESFVSKVPIRSSASSKDVPRILWCCWTGLEEMSDARRASLDAIRGLSRSLEVRLVTPENLEKVLIPGSPLPVAYKNLSAIHKSDVLRAYLMHHHGGGYIDIKHPLHEWAPVYELLDASANGWVAGYPLQSLKEATYIQGRLGRKIRRNFFRLPGFAAMICRPGTPLTEEWIKEVNRRVDALSEELRITGGNTYGDNLGYPVPWTNLGSQVFEPLCMKYLEHVLLDRRLMPQLHSHR